MANFAENYRNNHDVLTATTKGAVSGNQIMWAAVAATIFEELQKWVKPDAPKMIQKCMNDGSTTANTSQ